MDCSGFPPISEHWSQSFGPQSSKKVLTLKTIFAPEICRNKQSCIKIHFYPLLRELVGNLEPLELRAPGCRSCTGTQAETLQSHSAVAFLTCLYGPWRTARNNILSFDFSCIYVRIPPTLRPETEVLQQHKPSRLAGWSPQGGEQNLQVVPSLVLRFTQTLPALPARPGKQEPFLM